MNKSQRYNMITPTIATKSPYYDHLSRKVLLGTNTKYDGVDPRLPSHRLGTISFDVYAARHPASEEWRPPAAGLATASVALTVASGAYALEGIEAAPTLTLHRTRRYRIDASDPSCRFYPLQFYYSDGAPYTAGVERYLDTQPVGAETWETVAEHSSAALRAMVFVVPADAPDELRYADGTHPGMGGAVRVVSEFLLPPDGR